MTTPVKFNFTFISQTNFQGQTDMLFSLFVANRWLKSSCRGVESWDWSLCDCAHSLHLQFFFSFKTIRTQHTNCTQGSRSQFEYILKNGNNYKKKKKKIALDILGYYTWKKWYQFYHHLTFTLKKKMTIQKKVEMLIICAVKLNNPASTIFKKNFVLHASVLFLGVLRGRGESLFVGRR